MTDYGVTPEGFVKKPLAVILAEVGDDERDFIDQSLDLSPTGPIGQINNIFADQVDEAWAALEANYASRFPASASYAQLEGVCDITGIVRLAARASWVTLDLHLDAGATVPAGSIVSVGENGTRFATVTEVANSETYPVTVQVRADCTETGPYAAYAHTIDTIKTPILGWSEEPTITGDILGPYTLDGTTFSIGHNNGYPSLLQFNFAGGDPWTIDDVVTEINTQWGQYLVAENANGYLRISRDPGAHDNIPYLEKDADGLLFSVDAYARGLNPSDAVLGRNIETDPELRIRRLLMLNGLGAGTLEALIAACIATQDVTDVAGYQNTSDMPDEMGLPGNSFHMIVLGGTDADVAETIWLTGPAGIRSYGNTLVYHTDSMGVEQPIHFSRPQEVPIYITATVLVDPQLYSLDGDSDVVDAMLDIGNSLDPGDDVIALRFRAACLTVKGVLDVLDFAIDTVDPPVNTDNIVVDYTDIVTFSTLRTTVTSST